MKTSNPILRMLAFIAAVSALGLPRAFAADNTDVHVELKNAQGEKVGTAVLSPVSDGVKVRLRLTHVEPGKHGIHFHEKGSCVGPDFKSAGGHLNPEHKEHGLENPKGHHAGDLPNLDVSRSGTVKTEFVTHDVTLGSGANSLLRPEGTALVIHAKADDQMTSPAGASGDRVVCGVISPATPAAK
jgi:Cu-Zn family superoxide dismutase